MKITIFCFALLIKLSANAQDTIPKTESQEANPLRFSGFVEAYYSYDFNRPPDNRKPPFLYSHNRHNEFNINLAFIRGSYKTERIRANLAIALGTYMNANYAAEPGVLKNIYEANAGYKISRKKKLWFDLGVMPSHIGFESAHSPSCWALTRSLAAENSPYFESGAKLSYISDNGKLELAALALNGWQRIHRVDGNSLMSWGTQVHYKPSAKVALNYSTFVGTDKPDSARLWRYFHNVYAIFQFSEKFGLIAGFDIGMEQKKVKDESYNTWYTPVGILRFIPGSKWAMALRCEYYSDENKVIVSVNTPDGFETVGGSVNIDYLPAENMALRLEARHLKSKDAIFQKDGSLEKTNTAITFSMAISF